MDILFVWNFVFFMGNLIGGFGGFGVLRIKSLLEVIGECVVFFDLDIFFDGM